MQLEKVLVILILIIYHQCWHLDRLPLKTQVKWLTLQVLEMKNQHRMKSQKLVQSKYFILFQNYYIIWYFIYRTKSSKHQSRKKHSRSRSPRRKSRSPPKGQSRRYRSRSRNKSPSPIRFFIVKHKIMSYIIKNSNWWLSIQIIRP